MRLEAASTAGKMPALPGAFQSDVVQYKNQIPPKDMVNNKLCIWPSELKMQC
jgi:hypothetical protein